MFCQAERPENSGEATFAESLCGASTPLSLTMLIHFKTLRKKIIFNLFNLWQIELRGLVPSWQNSKKFRESL